VQSRDGGRTSAEAGQPVKNSQKVISIDILYSKSGSKWTLENVNPVLAAAASATMPPHTTPMRTIELIFHVYVDVCRYMYRYRFHMLEAQLLAATACATMPHYIYIYNIYTYGCIHVCMVKIHMYIYV